VRITKGWQVMTDKSDAIGFAQTAINTAGWVHGRHASDSEGKDFVDLANAIRQVALAVQALAKAVQ
jgi:hypothetical protein